MEEASQQLISERYLLQQLLGAGCSGQVFLARDTKLPAEPLVALKILKPQFAADERGLQRLKREVLLARELSHPNIVKIFELGIHQTGTSTTRYLVMEFVSGQTVASLLQQCATPLPFAQAFDLFMQLLAGLEYAHANSIVHRDLKPENLLLTAEGVLKVADFGAARSLLSESTITGTGDFFGSPAYMAPELFIGEPHDEQTDLYAAGLIGYELLSGRKAVDGANLYALSKQQMRKDLPSLQRKDVPSWFQSLLLGCTAKDRTNRFRTVHEVIENLNAKKTSFPYRRAQRLRASFLLLSVFAGAAIIATFIIKNSPEKKAFAAISDAITGKDIKRLDQLLEQSSIGSTSLNLLPGPILLQLFDAPPTFLARFIKRNRIFIQLKYEGFTLLQHAILKNRPAHATMLLEAGASTEGLVTTLRSALQQHNQEVLLAVVPLLPKAVWSDPLTELLTLEAIWTDQTVFLTLINAEAIAPDGVHEGIAAEIFKKGDLELFRAFAMSSRFDPLYQTSNWQNTTLHVAAITHAARFVPLLLALGADINARNKDGASPVAIALALDDRDTFCALARSEALEIRNQRISQRSLLNFATYEKKEEMIDLILAEFADRPE